jgi:hypothetical protein
MVHSLEKQEFMMGGFFFDWRDHQKPFEAMAIQSTMPHACDLIENNPAQLDCLDFDAGYLPCWESLRCWDATFCRRKSSPTDRALRSSPTGYGRTITTAIQEF